MKNLLFLLITILLTACGTTGSKTEKNKVPEIEGKLVFTNGKQIFTMNADGSNLTELTDLARGAFTPSWSPDGRKIIFSTGLKATTAGPSIYIMNADGSNLHPMKMLECCPVAGWNAQWSPNGSKIAFSNCINCEGGGGNYEIFIYNFNSDSVIRLTNSLGEDQYPTWSPSGNRIAFLSERDHLEDGGTDLYIMNADGSNIQRVTQKGNVGLNAWHPEEKAITYGRARVIQAAAALYSVNLLSGQIDKTEFDLGEKTDLSPNAWEPNGRYLLVTEYKIVSGPNKYNLLLIDMKKNEVIKRYTQISDIRFGADWFIEN